MPTDREQGRREGERLRDEAVARVERHRAIWVRLIQRAMVRHLMTCPTATTDDIRPVVDVPAEIGRAGWGAAVQGLVKARLVRRVGYVTSSRPSRHACPVVLWELAVEHAAALAWLDAHPKLPDPDDDAAGPMGSAPSSPPRRPPGPLAAQLSFL